MKFEGKEYEEDSSPLGPSFTSFQKWAYSSTGSFMYDDGAGFLAVADLIQISVAFTEQLVWLLYHSSTMAFACEKEATK